MRELIGTLVVVIALLTMLGIFDVSFCFGDHGSRKPICYSSMVPHGQR